MHPTALHLRAHLDSDTREEVARDEEKARAAVAATDQKSIDARLEKLGLNMAAARAAETRKEVEALAATAAAAKEKDRETEIANATSIYDFFQGDDSFL